MKKSTLIMRIVAIVFAIIGIVVGVMIAVTLLNLPKTTEFWCGGIWYAIFQLVMIEGVWFGLFIFPVVISWEGEV